MFLPNILFAFIPVFGFLRARRSPGNRRRGSGRVIPQSPKDALLAELMGPIAGLPQESARGAEPATAAASCVPQAAAPSGVEGSPSKGGRRRRFVRSVYVSTIPRRVSTCSPAFDVLCFSKHLISLLFLDNFSAL